MHFTSYIKDANSVIWILFLFIILIFGFSTYTIHNLFIEVNNFISVNNLLNPIDNNICIINKSIQSLLYKILLIYNICIIMQVELKLHSVNSIKLNYSYLNVKFSNGLQYYLKRIISYYK